MRYVVTEVGMLLMQNLRRHSMYTRPPAPKDCLTQLLSTSALAAELQFRIN
jgi:hypothetical protein